jgi:hypothetical protein
MIDSATGKANGGFNVLDFEIRHFIEDFLRREACEQRSRTFVFFGQPLAIFVVGFCSKAFEHIMRAGKSSIPPCFSFNFFEDEGGNGILLFLGQLLGLGDGLLKQIRHVLLGFCCGSNVVSTIWFYSGVKAISTCPASSLGIYALPQFRQRLDLALNDFAPTLSETFFSSRQGHALAESPHDFEECRQELRRDFF